MTRHSTAHFLLEGLVDAGIEYLFSNLGTDHVPLIEECARWARAGRRHPQIVLCPHENVAVHMAGGYASMTGRGQAVLVHVDVGSANAAMGLHNLRRARIPALLLAGKAPFTSHGQLPGSRDSYVQFIQEPFDIGSLVRPYVKWEHNLQSGAVSREVIRRAESVMHSDPQGPVYLTLPRETLMEEWTTAVVGEFPRERHGPVRSGGVDVACLNSIADRLLAARNPIAITSYLGRNPEAVGMLEELAQTCGMRVFESNPVCLNISRDSACFAGHSPESAIREADVGLLLDVDVPWLPRYVDDNPSLHWLQVDVDAVKQDLPMWGFPAEVRVQADCASVLRDVLAIVRTRATPAFRAQAAQRIGAFEDAHWRRIQASAQAASNPGRIDGLSADFVCARLNDVIRPDDIVVNEAIRNAPAVLNQISRTRPRTLLAAAGGGLGFSGGTALGVKLARPAARVIQVVGDGSFHLSAPTAVHAVAQQYRLPVLTVVLDNGGWKAVKEAVLRVYPEGEAAAADEFQARLTGERRNFAQVAQAFGAHGEQVRDPADLEPAIERSLAALDAGRSAVLDVKVSPL